MEDFSNRGWLDKSKKRYFVEIPKSKRSGRSSKEKRCRLVMQEKIGRKLNTDEIVVHKDGNTLNDVAENLELMTKEEYTSMIHSGKKKLGKGRRAKHVHNKLSKDKVINIILLHLAGQNYSQIARTVKVSGDTVGRYVKLYKENKDGFVF